MVRARGAALLSAALVVSAACTATVEPKDVELVSGTTLLEPAPETSETSSITTADSSEPPPTESVAVPGCSAKVIGESFGPIEVAYAVVDGRLGATPCLGTANPVVEDAWNDLVVFTPPQLSRGVTILAGFDDTRSDTLAFAGPVGNDSEEHLIAVGIGAAVDDPDELRLTMAHELAHVFTQTTDQIDVAVFANECDTFFNGFGCFEQDAYVTAFVDRFWDPQDLAGLPSDFSVDIVGGEQRCSIDPGFPGSYAASHPEEDFAESFSAYAFDVPMPAAFAERTEFFDQYPEFVAMREAVRRAGMPVPPGNFGACG